MPLAASSTDASDWQLNPKIFKYVNKLWGPHTIDRFATMENRMVDRYNSRWLDPQTEGVDSLRFSDAAWRRENNWCNEPPVGVARGIGA